MKFNCKNQIMLVFFKNIDMWHTFFGHKSFWANWATKHLWELRRLLSNEW